MAIVVDNTGTSTIWNSASSVTITSFAVGGGANRLLLIGVSYFTSSGTVTGITFNSVPLSSLDTNSQVIGASTQWVEFWYLKNPGNVTANIVATFTGAIDEGIIGADSWTGVDQVTTFGTVAKNQSATASLPTVTVTSNATAVVHDVVEGGDPNAALTATGTQRWQQANAAFGSRGLGQSKAGGASTVMNWTVNNLDHWTNMGVGINADLGTPSITYPSDMTPGCNIVFDLV